MRQLDPAMAVSLWDEKTDASTRYQKISVINSGFAQSGLTMTQVELDELPVPNNWQNAAAIVTFVRAIGLQANDVQVLSLRSPEGRLIAESTEPSLDKNKAQFLLFVGAKRKGESWPKGSYCALK